MDIMELREAVIKSDMEQEAGAEIDEILQTRQQEEEGSNSSIFLDGDELLLARDPRLGYYPN